MKYLVFEDRVEMHPLDCAFDIMEFLMGTQEREYIATSNVMHLDRIPRQALPDKVKIFIHPPNDNKRGEPVAYIEYRILGGRRAYGIYSFNAQQLSKEFLETMFSESAVQRI